VKALARALPQMTSLTTLTLCENEIGRDGVAALAGVLPHMPNAAALSLLGMRARTAG
jgi:hypothetical protein